MSEVLFPLGVHLPTHLLFDRIFGVAVLQDQARNSSAELPVKQRAMLEQE